jgi:D-beta-D-heptose 7-phosphate kinase / D-beta-D-heptose 1-phosphate adenosyltransferase
VPQIAARQESVASEGTDRVQRGSTLPSAVKAGLEVSSRHRGMFDFDKLLALICAETVLCVGDLMLDEFVYGEVARISPEAPAPVLAVSRSELAVGGAGNVARNIASLGARCIFVGVVGNDDAGRRLAAELCEPSIEVRLVIDPLRITTRKVRFVSEHFSTHLLRADWEQAAPIEGETENKVLDCALAALPEVASVVLSDYAKGLLTPRLLRVLLDNAKKLGKPVIVDPKGIGIFLSIGVRP